MQRSTAHEHRPSRAWLTLSIVLALGLSACGDQSDPAPPEIQNLILAPTTTILDGGDEAIYGIVEFSDPNGDAANIVIEVELPDGTIDEIDPIPLEGIHGSESGSVSFSLVYSRDNAGRYGLTVWLLDASGRASNELTGTIVSRF